MEIRYLGFDQRQNSRVYRFDVRTDERVTKQVTVIADIAVFRNHGVGMQEGPLLSGNKLIDDLKRGWEGEHELTSTDVRAYADAKALDTAHRAGVRKAPRHSPAVQAEAHQNSPWRNFRL